MIYQIKKKQTERRFFRLLSARLIVGWAIEQTKNGIHWSRNEYNKPNSKVLKFFSSAIFLSSVGNGTWCYFIVMPIATGNQCSYCFCNGEPISVPICCKEPVFLFVADWYPNSNRWIKQSGRLQRGTGVPIIFATGNQLVFLFVAKGNRCSYLLQIGILIPTDWFHELKTTSGRLQREPVFLLFLQRGTN